MGIGGHFQARRMEAVSRTSVLWLGGPAPAELVAALHERRILLKQVTEGVLLPALPTARAVLLPFEGDAELFRARARRTGDLALDHGLLIVLCCPVAKDREAFLQVVPPLKERFPSHRVRVPTEAWTEVVPELAEWIARYDPGPGSEQLPNMTGLPAWVTDEISILLSRAFFDFEEIHLDEIKPGHSGARLLKVHPVRQKPEGPARLQPYIVKIDERDRIAGEIEKYWKYVAGAVPFNQRPNLDERRYVEGRGQALLVQDFIERAVPLEEALQKGSAMLFLASLFESALAECRLCQSVAAPSIVSALNDLKLLDWSGDLDSAAREAARDLGATRGVADLRGVVEKLPNSPCVRCTIHGDLHAGNVFVATGSTDAILIDFYKTTLGPAVADTAALEVSLTFPSGEHDLSPELESVLLELYQTPLAAPSRRTVRGDYRWLWDAVRAVRVFTRAIESGASSPDPYAMAVAGYLLKFASYGDNLPLRRRAVAFWLAERLVP